MAKSKLTHAEKQALYEKRNASKVKAWDVQKKKVQWAALKENPEQWQDYWARENERIRLLQLKKKNQVTSEQNTDSPRGSAADENYRPYKIPQALGKAVSRAMLSLP